MFFLLQNESGNYSIDVLLLKNVLDKERYLHEYSPFSLGDFYDKKNNLMKKEEFPARFHAAIPVGTIEFVTTWLTIFKEIDNINPIEIPECLRTDEFLKRKYSIVDKYGIPDDGKYFVKDVSKLKVFSMDCYVNSIKEENEDLLNMDHLYQVSEHVDILSEYRVYIIDGEVEAVGHYNGDPTLFPDMNLIKKANAIYSMQKDYPKSYSLDILITDRGTSICEIHPYVSIGHYSLFFGSNLAYAYRDGIDYVVNHNTKITKFSNFNTN